MIAAFTMIIDAFECPELHSRSPYQQRKSDAHDLEHVLSAEAMYKPALQRRTIRVEARQMTTGVRIWTSANIRMTCSEVCPSDFVLA